MISRQSSQRRLAVVTGAAGGLGSAYAQQLARQAYDLLLIDRRAEPLDALCQSLNSQCDISAECLVIDFSDRGQIEQLAAQLRSLRQIDLLINNAGFGTLSHFVDTDPQLLLSMIDVHVVAPMLLTRAVLPRMLERNSGGIINVSSVSAWFHSAGNTHYGSTKICLAVFTQALHEELRGTNVCVQALCPGFVRTQFHSTECMRKYAGLLPSSKMWAVADEVAAFSLRCLSRKSCMAIPGYGYRLIGRLAQMPILQPIMRRFAHVPRTLQPVTPGEASCPQHNIPDRPKSDGCNSSKKLEPPVVQS